MTAPLHYEGHGDKPLQPFRRRRLRIPNACEACRLRKVKCDGGRPACSRCQERRKSCTYIRDSGVAAQQQVKRKATVEQPQSQRANAPLPILPADSRSHSLEASSTSTSQTPPTSGTSPRSEHLDNTHAPDPESDLNRACYVAHGRFAGDVAAAIDVKAGLVPATTSNLVPFVDAPLFGKIDLHPPGCVVNFARELPPRAYADRLVDIYWQYVDPVEIILDRKCFFQDYEALYFSPATSTDSDSDVGRSIINMVFALAVQRQESIRAQERDEEASRYFQRAWVLLRPETILWEPGSLELVQCLMLLNRYLHCTNNQQKTWMTAGLAVRIAQNMCCHHPEAPSAKDSPYDRQSKQRVWASCVALDRCVSWSLGRTSAPSLTSLPSRAYSTLQNGRHADYFTWTLELHEIGNQIQLAQTQSRNSLAAKLGAPRLYQQDDYHAVAVQLGACLDKWEDRLPSDWRLQNLQTIPDTAFRAERYLLHLRLLHTRIFLYRPMLARFYAMKSSTSVARSTGDPSSLGDRLLRECARMCVETAQTVTSLIIETYDPDEAIGPLPWWYRIYYLHIAGTNFLAAMFESDLFTESVSQSWHDNMAALRAHSHLSAYVQQCIWTFETLSARILETRYPQPNGGGNTTVEEGSAGLVFDDIFRDMDFDFNNFLFGMEN